MYSINEINERLDLAEQQAAAGMSIDNDEVFRRLNEEFTEDDNEHIINNNNMHLRPYT